MPYRRFATTLNNLNKMKKKICIIGAGGFAKEVYCLAIDVGLKDQIIAFIESEEIWSERIIHGIPVRPMPYFNPDIHSAVVAVGNPKIRNKIVDELPNETVFITLIHPNVIQSDWVKIGEGSIICSGCSLTCDITLGKHTHLNLNTTVGHDCLIGDYFTTAPSVNISGNCKIGNNVYMGTNSSIREKLTVTADVIVGMGGIVVKSIKEPGVYVGNPAKKIV